MRSKVVEDGKLRVFEDGTVYRILKNGEEQPIKPVYTSRNHDYKIVSVYENGAQRQIYIHHLVAKAFIPNPDNKNRISFKDGNPENVSVENLEWKTPKEMAQIAVPKAKATRTKICTICGQPTCRPDAVCTICKRDQVQQEKKDLNNAQIRDLMGMIDLDVCTPSERRAVELRSECLTLNEIAALLGCTRQCVDQQIKSALIKSATGAGKIYKNKKQITQVKNRLSRKRNMLERMEVQRSELIEEIQKLEGVLNILEEGGIRDEEQNEKEG